MFDSPAKFAVDGVLHYASYLSKEFNVIAVAVSGQSHSNLKISNYLWVKGTIEQQELLDKNKKIVEEILPLKQYIQTALFDHRIEKIRFDDLISLSKEFRFLISYLEA